MCTNHVQTIPDQCLENANWHSKYRTQISGYSLVGARESKGGCVKKRYDKEAVGDDGCVHFLDCEDAFLNVYICVTHVIIFKYVPFTV